jgi:hypothetical protein
MKILLGAMALTLASVAQAAPLTVRAGENWMFTIKDGQPTNAHKTEASAKPAKGELMISVRALFGTSAIITNNSNVSYSFNAELVPGRNVTAVRTCTLPAGGNPVVEQWDQRADAVRISNFRATGNEGRC